MNQTFNVTSCRTCPLMSGDWATDEDGFSFLDNLACKHPQGGVVSGMAASVIRGGIPIGCPLRTNAVLVRLCPSNDGRG